MAAPITLASPGADSSQPVRGFLPVHVPPPGWQPRLHGHHDPNSVPAHNHSAFKPPKLSLPPGQVEADCKKHNLQQQRM